MKNKDIRKFLGLAGAFLCQRGRPAAVTILALVAAAPLFVFLLELKDHK